jgi:hypothetical protein
VVAAIRKLPYWQAGTPDPLLTSACRVGDFASLPLNRIVVRFTAPEGRGVLQMIPPLYHHLLIDRAKLARPGESYYFYGTGQPDCRVWVTGEAKGRALPAGRGTALPPTDPRALPKRLAQIKSWPK